MDAKELEKWLRNDDMRAYAAWPQEVREAWEGVPLGHKRVLASEYDTQHSMTWRHDWKPLEGPTAIVDNPARIYSISPDYHLPERAGIRWCKIEKREGDLRYQIREDDGTQCELWLDLSEAVTNGAIGYRSDQHKEVWVWGPVAYLKHGLITRCATVEEIESGAVEIVRADWVGFEQ